jgi:hypothetical protein
MRFEYLDSQIIYSYIEIEYINTSIDIPAGAKRHLTPRVFATSMIYILL